MTAQLPPAPPPPVLLGLVGRGIGASLAPALHEREGRRHGLDLHYRLLDAERLGLGAGDLADLLRWAQHLGYAGLNATHPFKQAVLPLLDELTPDAEDLGAVNTVVLRDGVAVGTNTDWTGCAAALRAALPGTGTDRAVVVGAGGAGSAVGYALLQEGAEHVTLVDDDTGRAAGLAARLAARFGADRVTADTPDRLQPALASASGLVNATPLGMHGHPGSAVPAHLLAERLWVFDVVYRPLETELVTAARSRGCRVLTGGLMAVHQAVGAFEAFTGLPADAARVEADFLELAGLA